MVKVASERVGVPNSNMKVIGTSSSHSVPNGTGQPVILMVSSSHLPLSFMFVKTGGSKLMQLSCQDAIPQKMKYGDRTEI